MRLLFPIGRMALEGAVAGPRLPVENESFLALPPDVSQFVDPREDVVDLAVKSALEGASKPLGEMLRRCFDNGSALVIGLDLHDAGEGIILNGPFGFIVDQPKKIIAMVHQKLPFQMKVAPGNAALLCAARRTDQGGRLFEERGRGRLCPSAVSIDIATLRADGRFRGSVMAAMSALPIGDLAVWGDVWGLPVGIHGVAPNGVEMER